MSFVLGVLIGLAIGVVSYLLFVATSRELPHISPPEVSTEVATGEVENNASVPQILDAINALSVGVVVVDEKGVEIFRNKLAESVTGIPHADVLVEEVVEQHVKFALNGETKRQVLDLFGPPRKVFSVSATPLLVGGAVVMIEDITERFLVCLLYTSPSPRDS